ncbi:hypothetical protein, partial [Akkermansia sp.]|uniref:hypothetical protein n=1 Tax=Akkermansia sp. TaxID=1872421 RepID=UPI003AF08311
GCMMFSGSSFILLFPSRNNGRENGSNINKKISFRLWWQFGCSVPPLQEWSFPNRDVPKAVQSGEFY